MSLMPPLARAGIFIAYGHIPQFSPYTIVSFSPVEANLGIFNHLLQLHSPFETERAAAMSFSFISPPALQPPIIQTIFLNK